MAASQFIFISANVPSGGRQAEELFDEIVEQGGNPWYCARSIAAGSNWGSEIYKTVANSRVMVLLLTENYLSSAACLEEMVFARGETNDAASSTRVTFLPVCLDGKPPNWAVSDDSRVWELRAIWRSTQAMMGFDAKAIAKEAIRLFGVAPTKQAIAPSRQPSFAQVSKSKKVLLTNIPLEASAFDVIDQLLYGKIYSANHHRGQGQASVTFFTLESAENLLADAKKGVLKIHGNVLQATLQPDETLPQMDEQASRSLYLQNVTETPERLAEIFGDSNYEHIAVVNGNGFISFMDVETATAVKLQLSKFGTVNFAKDRCAIFACPAEQRTNIRLEASSETTEEIICDQLRGGKLHSIMPSATKPGQFFVNFCDFNSAREFKQHHRLNPLVILDTKVQVEWAKPWENRCKEQTRCLVIQSLSQYTQETIGKQCGIYGRVIKVISEKQDSCVVHFSKIEEAVSCLTSVIHRSKMPGDFFANTKVWFVRDPCSRPLTADGSQPQSSSESSDDESAATNTPTTNTPTKATPTKATAEQQTTTPVKQRLTCVYFAKGTCKKGDKCDRDHDLSRYKRSLCSYFQAGTCQRGENCTYAHGEAELRKFFPQA